MFRRINFLQKLRFVNDNINEAVETAFKWAEEADLEVVTISSYKMTNGRYQVTIEVMKHES